MRIRSFVAHSARTVATGALIALLVGGLAAGTTFAGKDGLGAGSGGAAVIGHVSWPSISLPSITWPWEPTGH